MESILSSDDSELYSQEQLRKINPFYFTPYLDEAVPYKSEAKILEVKTRRELLKGLMSEWKEIADEYSLNFAKVNKVREES